MVVEGCWVGASLPVRLAERRQERVSTYRSTLNTIPPAARPYSNTYAIIDERGFTEDLRSVSASISAGGGAAHFRAVQAKQEIR